MAKRRNGHLRALIEAAARAETDECIEVGVNVRPVIMIRGKQMNASRYSWIVTHGDPGDLFVLHTCDNKMCVNIRHLYLGDQLRNVSDMHERNRRTHVNYARGERAGRARMTPDAIRIIRTRYQAGDSQQRIADDYGVTQEAISAIVRRKSWAHIE